MSEALEVGKYLALEVHAILSSSSTVWVRVQGILVLENLKIEGFNVEEYFLDLCLD